jgi:hypothetical protein
LSFGLLAALGGGWRFAYPPYATASRSRRDWIIDDRMT